MSINISCADCNAIRPFSGGPPNWKCEVCGWELGTSSRRPVAQSDAVPNARPDAKQPRAVNLSCAKCRVVRSFSGDPLQCDVCGWMVTTAGQFSATDQLVRCGKCKKPRRDVLDEICQYCGHKGFEVISKDGVADARPNSKESTVMDRVADSVAAFLKIIFLGIGLVVAIYYTNYYFFMPEADRIANEYSIPSDKVVVDKKPHGCDYNDAPLGEKHCHFEKDLNVVRECEQPNCKVREVYVSWRKVSE